MKLKIMIQQVVGEDPVINSILPLNVLIFVTILVSQ